MNKLVDDGLIKFAEILQLPERVVDTEEMPWIPFEENEVCHFKPIRFDFTRGTWTYLFKIKSNQTLTRHRHTGGSVMGYNLQGRWRYAEKEWIAKPGTFIFEPPGDIHTLITEGEDVISLFILGGSLQYFDEQDQIIGQDDIFSVYKKYCDYCNEKGMPIREDLRY
ncbi:2,4'-dihydroxyacetophenone dioxygenase family protein [Bacillus sp. NEB1478]|uniref:2,4'-dihydroxyacetophenone dioxygenase family protein n=1 Tax=Bacillus sp. NEB1478 TaxID=3073816 RepID=UPI002873C24A|nr:2,4'-dihydroxyacetophenone dioxygenase family protein [Bacillus sp. NEB1478]WNB90894.1 2,4'-dihydroxyacetophenone dioxygenase family protein [Bacillus sp. NEB1478]